MTQSYRTSLNKQKEVAAFVLVNAKLDSEKQVISDAKAIHDIKETYLCWGIFDIILKIRSNSIEELKDLLTNKLRKIENVRSVLTLLIIEENKISEALFNHRVCIKPLRNEDTHDPFYEETSIRNSKSPILEINLNNFSKEYVHFQGKNNWKSVGEKNA